MIEQIVGESTAAVVLALTFDMHTFPKVLFFPQFLRVASHVVGQLLLL